MTIENIIHTSLNILINCHQIELTNDINYNNLDIESFDKQLIKFMEYNKIYHSMILNEVSRRSSINQGKCFLRAVMDSFQTIFTSIQYEHVCQLSNIYKKSLNADTVTQSHYIPLFGVLTSSLFIDLSLEMSIRLYLKCLVRDMLAAATRLNIIGCLESMKISLELSTTTIEYMIQNILVSNIPIAVDHHDHHTNAPEAEEESMWIDNPNSITITTTSPILDIIQARHDLLYSRLFNS